MTDNDGLGIAGVQLREQSEQGCLLCRSTGVGRLATDVQTALVADADAVAVVVPAVGADL